MPIQLQKVEQNVRNVLNQNVSPTRRWWSIIAIIMSLIYFIVRRYQFVVRTVMNARQIIVVSVNVNQVRTIIKTIVDQRRRQVQRRNRSYSSHPYLYLCTFVLFSVSFDIRVSLSFVSCHSIHHYLTHLVWQPSQTQ